MGSIGRQRDDTPRPQNPRRPPEPDEFAFSAPIPVTNPINIPRPLRGTDHRKTNRQLPLPPAHRADYAGAMNRTAFGLSAVILATCLIPRSTAQTVKLRATYQPTEHRIVAWRSIEDLPRQLAQFDNVFWDPRDTPSLRKLIRTSNICSNKTVMEIGVGTGLLSLCALQNGAAKVVGTDINPAAFANAKYNATGLKLHERFDCRLVTKEKPGAFEVIKPDEKFDIIVSNPPWVNQKPNSDYEFALYDPGFHLLKTLLDGLPRHLKPGGKVLLAYGSVSGIKAVKKMAGERGYSVKVIDDDRDLEKLPEEFLPGMLLEVTVSAPRSSNQCRASCAVRRR